MTYNATPSVDKLLSTGFLDFGNHEKNRFGRISWSKHEKNGANTKFLEIQVKVFRRNEQGEFKVFQNINMGELDFKDFIRMKTELVDAATDFGKQQNLQPITLRPFSRDMETQLKLVHKVCNVVDRPHRKICVTMLRYNVEEPESSYVQIRLFGKLQKDGNFRQIVYVNYKLAEFMELLDIMDSARDKILNNEPLVQTPIFIDDEEDMEDTTPKCKRPRQPPPKQSSSGRTNSTRNSVSRRS